MKKIRSDNPPRIAEKFISLFAHYQNRPYILGDLDEDFSGKCREKGRFFASLWYWSNCFLILPGLLKFNLLWRFFMLRNYIITAFRSIMRHKGISLINILGLGIAFACSLLIIIYINFETGYDNYHRNVDRIYRVGIDIDTPDFKRTFSRISFPLGPYLKENFPQVEASGRLWQRSNVLVQYEGKSFYEDRFYYADKDIFSIFSFSFIYGNTTEVFRDPGTVVITESISGKYFGGEDPTGKVISVNGNDFIVSAVVNNAPENTHFKYNFIVSLNEPALPKWIHTNWKTTMASTYVVLKEGTNREAFISGIMNKVLEGVVDSGDTNNYFLQPIRDIHLHSNLSGELESPGDPLYLYIFAIIAGLILIIANINFINISTARSANRAKEVGVRKVIGANRKQLVSQFLGESFIITIIALIVAWSIVFLSRDYFGELLGIRFTSGDFININVALSLAVIVFLSGFAAGSYPAIFLSSFKPISVLKGKLRSGAKGSSLRRIMVICQFSISIILVASTLVVFRQVSYMKNEKLGFSKEQKLVIPVRRGADISDNYEMVKKEFTGFAGIYSASVSSGVPGRTTQGANIKLLNVEDDKSQWMHYMFVDNDFISAFELELIAGSSELKAPLDESKTTFILNETTVKLFRWHSPEEALTKNLWSGYGGRHGPVVGVVKDFHFRGLQQQIGPVILNNYPEMFRYITLTVDTANLKEILLFVGETWQKLFPGIPLEYYFLDDMFDNLYRSEEKTGTLIGTFTLLGLIIACLGLFSLASFIADQRNKEIAIRKVHGASFADIAFLQYKDILKWILISNLIAWPVSYYAAENWLENYANRIGIDVWLFAVSGLATLVIALLTISYHTVKVASSNPVNSLRYE